MTNKMTDEDWKKLKYFSKDEKWGDPLMMSSSLIYRMEELRHFVGQSIIIHCGYELTGHATNSYHYQGLAVDFHIKGLSLLEQYCAAEACGFTGIGAYPFWNNPGLHVDIRPKKDDGITTWWCDKNKQYHYPIQTKMLI